MTFPPTRRALPGAFACPGDASASRRAFLAASGGMALGGLLAAPAAWGQASGAPAADGAYEPKRGQSGKDVIWIPTPDALVDRMLRLGQLTPQDFVMDLGSGDGKIVIAAALQGARAEGIEYNGDLVELSRRRAAAAGVAERTRFERADIFASDFSRATLITLYLLPRLNLRLRPRLMALKAGTRIVSHEFRMGKWKPDETSRVGYASMHLWLVPANVGGDWRLDFTQASGPVQAMLEMKQSFQHPSGVVGFSQFETSLREARVAGNELRFGFIDEDGHLRRFLGQVSGDTLTGTVQNLTTRGPDTPFTARRLGAAAPIEGAGEAPESEAEWMGEE
ncbi:MAG: methyltransferase domain-containing protein [Pseudomonadota bacterium]|nr:methyltransferase domain-containing protein [Pseudomonadota bacterium]